MSAEFKGFSIREYVSKMRTVDVEKCWPFGEEGKKVNEQEVVDFLPPITVTKFKWWSDELELVRSDQVVREISRIYEREEELEPEEESESVIVRNEVFGRSENNNQEHGSRFEGNKLEVVCPVCEVFKATSVKAVNAHVNSCLLQASREERRQMKAAAAAKGKAPKKRSIAEIFQVAPQVETVESDEDGESVNKVSPNCSKKKKNTLMVKKLKKKMNNYKNGSISNKEKSYKLKLQTPFNFTKIQKGSSSKRFATDIWDAVSIHKRKTSLKFLSTEKKRNVVRTSKLVAKHKKPLLPVCGILKNHSKVFSGKNSSKTCDMKHCCEVNSRGIQKSERHVKFNDDILGPRKKHVCSTECPKLQNICSSSSPSLPVRGILKNRTKVVSGKSSSKICDMKYSSEANPCGIQKSKRHVSFNDEILGPRKKHVYSTERPKVKNICSSSSDGVPASSETDWHLQSDTELSASELIVSDEDVSTSTENGNEVQPTIGNKGLSDIQNDMPSSSRLHVSCQEKVDHLSNKSLFPSEFGLFGGNLHMFGHGNPTVSHKASYSGIHNLLFPVKEHHNPIINSQFGGSTSRASNAGEYWIDDNRYPRTGVADMSSLENMNGLPQSSSCFPISDIASGRIPFLSQSTTENGRTFQYPPSRHLTPKELMASLCSPPWWKQNSFMIGEKRMGQSISSLPLNSQGELIQLNSSCKGGFNQMKQPSAVTGSSSSIPVYNHVLPNRTGHYLSSIERHNAEIPVTKDPLNWFPVPKYVKENLNLQEFHGTERTDIDRLNYERGNNHSVCLREPDLNMTNISCHGCRQRDQVHSRSEIRQTQPLVSTDQMLLHTSQPTMRLMGKDLTVGGSSKKSQGFEDGKVWTDKEIITENHPTSRVLDNSSVNSPFLKDWLPDPESGKSKETVHHSFDIRSNQASQSILQMQGPDPRFSRPYANWQTSLPSQRNASFKPQAFASPTSPALFDRASFFQEPIISGTGSLKVSSQVPVAPSTHRTSRQHMDLSSAELNYKQCLSQATKSAFEFPFLHPDCSEHAQPSWFHETSKNLPPWLLNAAQQEKALINSSQPYSVLGNKQHPCTMSGPNSLSIPSVLNSSDISHPYNPLTPRSHKQDSLSPASLAHPPLVNSTPSINPGYMNISKVKEIMKSKSFPDKDIDPSNKTKKRPATYVHDSIKPTRIPIFMQETSSAVTGLKARGNSNQETQSHAGALELHLDKDRGSGVGCGPKECNSNVLKTCFVSDYSTLDGKTHLDKNRESGVECDPKESNSSVLKTCFVSDSSTLDCTARSDPIKHDAGAKHIQGALEPHSHKDIESGVGCGTEERNSNVLKTCFVSDSSTLDGTARSGPIKLSAGAKHIQGALEPHSDKDRGSGVGCDPEERNSNVLKTCFVSESFTLDGTIRSGPIKLSAGAKHILKPSKKLDQDNSRPTHSTIHLAEETISGGVLETRKKLAKIYRF